MNRSRLAGRARHCPAADEPDCALLRLQVVGRGLRCAIYDLDDDTGLFTEEWAERRTPITEELIQRLHAFVFVGPRARPTPYRDGQNAIRDAATGALVHLPPRTVRDLLQAWLTQGWLELADPARKSRRYRLSAEYRRFIGGLSAE